MKTPYSEDSDQTYVVPAGRASNTRSAENAPVVLNGAPVLDTSNETL